MSQSLSGDLRNERDRGEDRRNLDCEETLVPDGRNNVGPAQFVEDKLASMLREAPLHLSHVRLLGLGRRSLG